MATWLEMEARIKELEGENAELRGVARLAKDYRDVMYRCHSRLTKKQYKELVLDVTDNGVRAYHLDVALRGVGV